jgi:hypothetical protein
VSIVVQHEVDLNGRRVILELRGDGRVWVILPDWPPVALEDMRRRGRPPRETTLILRPEPA